VIDDQTMPPRKKRSAAERPSAPADATDPPPPPAAVKKEEEQGPVDGAAAGTSSAAAAAAAAAPNAAPPPPLPPPPPGIVTMGATMFLEVQNDGKGPAVRSQEAEERAVEAAVTRAFGPAPANQGPLCHPGRATWTAPSDLDDDDDDDDDDEDDEDEYEDDGRGRVPEFGGYASGNVLVLSLPDRSGCELTLGTVLKVRACVLGAADWQTRPRPSSRDKAPPCAPCYRTVSPVVVVTGTDAMEELALALDLLLPHHCFHSLRRQPASPRGQSRAPPVACVVTGAMRPASALCPDGPSNLADALVAAKAAAEAVMASAASSGATPVRPGVLVAMGGQLHAARHVRKVSSDGDAGSAFSSGPSAGPVGIVSSSRTVAWAHGGGPPPPAALPLRARPGEAPPPQPSEEFDRVLMALGTRDLRTRVPIWTLTTDAMAPPEALLDSIDGLVLAGAGAGSVARSVLETLAPAAKARNLPVVLCSRCGAGPNHDAGLYGERSVAQYEEAGLEVWRGEFGRLSPVQARLALSVALSVERARERWDSEEKARWEERRDRRRARVVNAGILPDSCIRGIVADF
jgi:L-asparaginase/Glu-tRNA(Gln) amidotransferase subunit D